MTCADEMAEFVLLWGKLQNMQLTEGHGRRWTTNGEYTSKSAYEVQLRDS
jgi:hypothetical protein